MKRNVKIMSLLAMSCILLTGCGGAESSADSSSAQSTPAVVSTSDEQQSSENSSQTEPAAGNEPVSESDPESGTETGSEEVIETVTLTMPVDLDGTPLDLSKMNYTCVGGEYYIFTDFAWFAYPTGKAMVTVDGTVPKPEEYSQPEFKRRKKGEHINGLTIQKCETEIDVYDGQSFFNGCKAEFEGTSQLTGYAFIQPEDEYMMPKDEIYFLPEEGGCSLPVIYNINTTMSDPISYNGICWGNEYDRWFDLGSISDYSGKEWLSLLPENGNPVRVTATVSNIKMSWYNDSHMSGNGWLICTIDDLELA